MATRRRLPHVYPDGRWLFLTWHLFGSLPTAAFPPSSKLTAGQAFVWMDRYADSARSGPLFLKQAMVAQIVCDSFMTGIELGHYELGAFVVMANHVHGLLRPRISLSQLLQSLKGFTARQANKALKRTGEPFWQRECYDHWVRDEAEWARIAAYIEENPVKAGLVARAEDFPWSSANRVWRERVAGLVMSSKAGSG